MLEGVGVIRLLTIQDCNRLGYLVARHMMVADDEVDSSLARVLDLINRFDAAVQSDDQCAAFLLRVVDSAERYAIALGVAVGDVVVDVGVERAEEAVHECDGCCAIYVVVAVDEYFFAAVNCA